MNRIILTIISLLLLSSWAVGQNLIEPTGQKSSKNVAILNNRIAVVDYQNILIDLNVLQQKAVAISFFDLHSTVFKDKLEVRGQKNFSWFGSSEDKMTSVILTVLGDDIQGVITQNTEVYRIETVEDNYYITKIDQSRYPKEECFKVEHGKVDNNNSFFSSDGHTEHGLTPLYKKISGEPFTCRLRLLVMYTPAARDAVSNIQATIQLAVDEMRQSFVNSEIEQEVELVYVGEVDYAESGFFYGRSSEDDLIRFAREGDGHMDDVHILREKHQADICVLISADRQLCGIAAGLKVSSEYAFCIVNHDCATGNYSFAHEIGHLIGCDHGRDDLNLQSSGIDYPYDYAFGYKSPANDWRTIMSFNCPDECPRLLFWSNPDVNRGSVPMGTAQDNNARLIREKIPNAMSYLDPADIVQVKDRHIRKSHEGDIIAIEKVETDEEVTVKEDMSYSFRAGGEVVLNDRFTAEGGTDFVAEIVNVDNCGQADGEEANFGGHFVLDEALVNSTSINNMLIGYKVYPNPTSDIVNISFSTVPSSEVGIKVYNFLGQEVLRHGENNRGGFFQKTLDVSQLENGVYFITVFIGKEKALSTKFIKS